MDCQGQSVAIAITTYRNPGRLSRLLDNMEWAGWPSIPTYVFVDHPPDELVDSKTRLQEVLAYQAVCRKWNVPMVRAEKWGCMQGIIELALEKTTQDWIIYVPDDILFTKGGLYNEYAGVLTYGKPWVGAIQAPYWNADDLSNMSVLPPKDEWWDSELPPVAIPRNGHWDFEGLPRSYINVNGAGFSISRRLWAMMEGWPPGTWRLDEYAGYKAWTLGMVCITLPGPPRIHYMGGATNFLPEGLKFASIESWVEAVGKTPEECGHEVRSIMARYWGGDGIEYPDLVKYATRA